MVHIMYSAFLKNGGTPLHRNGSWQNFVVLPVKISLEMYNVATDRCTPNSQAMWNSVTFHAQRNTSGETQSAQCSIALFVASDAKDTWQSCRETVTQGCVTLWSEPAVSVFRQNKGRTRCLPSFFSLLLLKPLPHLHSVSPSSTTSTHTHTQVTLAHLFTSVFSPLTYPPFPSPSPPRDQG